MRLSVPFPAAIGIDTTAAVPASLTSTVIGLLKRPLASAPRSSRLIAP